MTRPVWGVPWHGLVRGGMLELPNRQRIAYPQPGGDGSTALIQHPAATPVSRTPEEQAADAAAGRQWWHQAILASSQLHGVNLNGWLYIDPAGENWLVQTTLPSVPVSGGSATFTLKRFGVFGAAAVEHSYAVSVPDMGQATPEIFGSNGELRLSRYHVRPDGSAAVFEVAAWFNADHQLFWPWRPVGWLEVRLAGAGAAADIDVAVLKTRAQTLGSVHDHEWAETPDNYYLRENADLSHDVLQVQPTSGNWWLAAGHAVVEGQASSGVTGYVVAMHYDAGGVRHEITLDSQVVTHYSSPAMAHDGATHFAPNVPVTGSWTCSTDWDSTWTLTYKRDGAPLCSYSVGVAEHSTQTYTLNDGSPPTLSTEARADFTPGAWAESSRVSESTARPGPVLGGVDLATEFYAPAEPGGVPSGMGGGGLTYTWYFEPNHLRYLVLCPYRYSKQLFGLALWQLPQQADDSLVRTVYQPDVATPGGVTTFPELALENSSASSTFTDLAYGSWCPVTGQSVRDIEPVCYV